jgi:hypothetical protein
MGMFVRCLVDFPYVLVRLRCDACKRAGSYRLVRLAVKYGAEILLDDLLVRLSADCPWRDDPRGACGARFTDLPPRRPPDLPAALMRFRVVKGGKV